MPQITIGKGLAFYEEAQALPGVKRVAGMVKQDIELVTGILPAGITAGQGVAVPCCTVPSDTAPCWMRWKPRANLT